MSLWKKKEPDWREEHERLWGELVPRKGQANTLQGELIRISAKLADEAYRNGNENWSKQHELLLNILIDILLADQTLTEKEKQNIKAAKCLILNNLDNPQFEESTGYYYLSKLVVKWCLSHKEMQYYEPRSNIFL
jgi:hypothetical protein